MQNILHEEDPEKHPRDARTAYFIDRKEAEKVFSDAKKKGEEVIAFYHSHINMRHISLIRIRKCRQSSVNLNFLMQSM